MNARNGGQELLPNLWLKAKENIKKKKRENRIER